MLGLAYINRQRNENTLSPHTNVNSKGIKEEILRPEMILSQRYICVYKSNHLPRIYKELLKIKKKNPKE
jgi:hypothetical protein